jgi:integrase/recombinase XerD
MTPIAPLITSFLREHMPIEQGCSPHTCETYAHAFRLLFVFASKRLGSKPSQICIEQIDAALILDFLAHIEEQRGNCAATRNGRLAAVKAFIRYVEFRVPSALAQARQIHAIPSKRHDQALVRHLTINEVRAILNAPNTTTRLGIRDRAMLHLCRWKTYPCSEHRAFAFSARAGGNDAFRSGRNLRPISVPGWLFEARHPYPSCS